MCFSEINTNNGRYHRYPLSYLGDQQGISPLEKCMFFLEFSFSNLQNVLQTYFLPQQTYLGLKENIFFSHSAQRGKFPNASQAMVQTDCNYKYSTRMVTSTD